MALCVRNVKHVSKLLNTAKSRDIRLVSLGSFQQLLRNHSTIPGLHRFHRHLIHARGISPGLLRNAQVVCGVYPVRNNSTAGQDAAKDVSSGPSLADSDLSLPDGYIPEPPMPAIADLDLNALGEPTLQSLGLCSNWPSGLVQWGLENLHVCMDLPWWGSIMIGTVCLRLLTFPLVIMGRRNAINMQNHMPTVQRLQEKFTAARQSGNPMEAARYGNELMDYMKRNNFNPARSFLVPMAQAPVFISVFIGLRQMANLPVLSMKEGGIFWFMDLTVPDPFFLLPLLTSATLLASIELGVDTVSTQAMGNIMKWVMRGLPICLFPFMMNFPAALLCYWFTSNAFSLGQVALLKIPRVRQLCKIPEVVKHEKSAKQMNQPKKRFVQGIKDNWNNSKLAASVEERQRHAAVRFKEAGTGPIQKTYPFDPTKVKPKSQQAHNKSTQAKH